MDGARHISMWSKQSVEGVLVRNRTARVMEAFHVAALDEPVFPQGFPGTALSQNRVLSTTQPRGRKNDRERIVVYLEHCGQEGESWSVAEGLTACCIVFPEGDGVRLDDYRYARAVEAVTGYLEASRTSVGACARVVCRTEENVNIGEGEGQKTATWCYVFVTPEKDLIQAELFEPLYSWEKSGQTHVAPAKLYAPRVTREASNTPEIGGIIDITWEEIDELVQICSPFDFGIDDDPLEAGTRVHARWDSSAGAWIAIRGGGGSSASPLTRLSVDGYAVGGMSWIAGQDMQLSEIESLPCFATDLAVQNPRVETLDTVAMKKDYPATYATLEGSGSPVAGVFISHPTHIRNQESSAEVTHSFCLDGGSHGGYHRFRFNNRFCIGRDDDYGTHFVVNGDGFSDLILYPSHQKINDQPYWISTRSDVSGIDNSSVWCLYLASDGWTLSQQLGVPFWMAGSQSGAFYQFGNGLPTADGQGSTSTDETGSVAATLEFYYPRWQSANEHGQYTPAGNLRSLELNASGTFYVGNPVWQTTFDGLSPTLTKSSVKHGDAYAWLAEENFESLENGRMAGDDNKWWEVENNADILDRQGFTLVEFYLDEDNIKTATGRTAVYTFKEYAAAPAGEIQAVWLVTPEILS